MAYQLPDDPLGIGLRQRANASRQAYEAQNRELGRQNGQLVSFSNLGPLSDPMWDAFKQAYHERGVDKFSGAAGLSPVRGDSRATGLLNTDAFGRPARISGQNVLDRQAELAARSISRGVK